MAVGKDRAAKAELNRRSQICEALTGTGVRVAKKIPKRTESGTRPLLRPCGVSASRPDSLGKVDGHESNALSISVWKTDVCLSTPMPEEMESRAGIAPAFAALQADGGGRAQALRPTGCVYISTTNAGLNPICGSQG